MFLGGSLGQFRLRVLGFEVEFLSSKWPGYRGAYLKAPMQFLSGLIIGSSSIPQKKYYMGAFG